MAIKVSLILPVSHDACSIYRGLGPYMRMPIEYKVFDGSAGFALWEAVMFGDVIFMQRPCSEQMVAIAQIIKNVGKKLIIDWDDNLSILPEWNPHVRQFDGCLPHLQKLAQIADVVTVSSVELLERVTEWGAKNPKLIPNAIDDSFKLLPKVPRSNRIVWRGGPSHQGDLDMAKDVIIDFGKENEIVFMGDAPSWVAEVKHHKIIKLLDYINYIMLLNSLAPQLLLVPLIDCAFNAARSDVAAQEAFLVGADIWHNNVGSYKNLPTKGTPRWLSDMNKIRMQILRKLI